MVGALGMHVMFAVTRQIQQNKVIEGDVLCPRMMLLNRLEFSFVIELPAQAVMLEKVDSIKFHDGNQALAQEEDRTAPAP